MIGSTGLGGNNPALAFGPDGTLYGVTSTNNFIRIDTSNAAGTIIGPIGVSGVSALAMRTDSATVKAEERESTVMARAYELYQNYPNPFNPSTTIRYSLAHAEHVSLKVFNLAGQEIATLFEGKQSAGEHHVQWQAESAPSGVYFYRLQVGEKVETRKMILMQ